MSSKKADKPVSESDPLEDTTDQLEEVPQEDEQDPPTGRKHTVDEILQAYNDFWKVKLTMLWHGVATDCITNTART